MSEGTERLEVVLESEAVDALRELASARGTSVTQVVNDALKLYAFLGEELAGKSQQLVVYDSPELRP